MLLLKTLFDVAIPLNPKLSGRIYTILRRLPKASRLKTLDKHLTPSLKELNKK